ALHLGVRRGRGRRRRPRRGEGRGRGQRWRAGGCRGGRGRRGLGTLHFVQHVAEDVMRGELLIAPAGDRRSLRRRGRPVGLQRLVDGGAQGLVGEGLGQQVVGGETGSREGGALGEQAHHSRAAAVAR